jgi:VanZ family protein
LLVTALFFVVEGVQVLILSCRADAFEFIVNAAGGITGAWLASMTIRLPDERKALPTVRSGSLLPAIGLAAAVLFYAIYNWSPFNFDFSPAIIRDRIGDLTGTPFYGYYVNPQFKALADALTKISLGVPIGLFLQMWLAAQAMLYTRVASAAALFLTAIFLTVVEAGQVVLPTRYPDDTDIILAFIGVVFGMWLVRTISASRGHAPALPPPGRIRSRRRRHSSRHSRRRAGLPTSQGQ